MDPWWDTEQKETQGDYKLHSAVLLLLVIIRMLILKPISIYMEGYIY